MPVVSDPMQRCSCSSSSGTSKRRQFYSGAGAAVTVSRHLKAFRRGLATSRADGTNGRCERSVVLAQSLWLLIRRSLGTRGAAGDRL
jgi:hypothetical protein